jgi:hypothetical protein
MPSRRHSESDMNLIRTARKNMANSIDLMRQLGDDGVDTTPSDATKSYDENGMETTPQDHRNGQLERDYKATAYIYGRWSHYEAHYFDVSPFASEGIKCANCVFYRKATDAVGVCEIVEGAVSAEGICKLWIIPAELRAPEGMTNQVSEAEAEPTEVEAMATKSALDARDTLSLEAVKASLRKALGR